MFCEKVVLVTGASAGIGAVTAIHFAKHGATLVLTGRNLENLSNIAAKCFSENKKEPLVIQGDLTVEKDVNNIIETTINTFKKLDVLVNNAGIVDYGGIQDTEVEQLDKLYKTNLRSVFLLTHLAVPHLIRSKGNIINVSSVAGQRSFPILLTYCMSKAALDQFTKCVALELASKQVRVNSVNPGLIDTEIHVRAGMTTEQYQAHIEMGKETHPIGRIGTVEDVAYTILFLAGYQASFITGETIHIDGGKHALTPL